jgi:N-acetylglucosamine-1-phosphodiester alpha-N-acetylglucosaminidase
MRPLAAVGLAALAAISAPIPAAGILPTPAPSTSSALSSSSLGDGNGPDDVVLTQWPTAPFAPLATRSWAGQTPKTGRNYTAHIGVVQDASLFSIELPHNGCATRTNTSVAAAMFGCQLATNGGFFSFSGACEGDAIVNGSVVIWEGQERAVMGMLPNKTTAIGYVAESGALPFTTLLSGLGWLVRDGANYVNQSREFLPNASKVSFVTEKAPRTAIGVMKDGSVFQLVVDGVEVLGVGPDLFEMADILVQAGAMHAINVDGGGSSDAVLDGKVWSRPTCDDQPSPLCERPVTTITCTRYAK